MLGWNDKLAALKGDFQSSVLNDAGADAIFKGTVNSFRKQMSGWNDNVAALNRLPVQYYTLSFGR